MTNRKVKSGTIDVKAVLAEDGEFLRALARAALQEVLEAEMTEALSAEKGERTAGRLGYRSGYYDRTLITRVGKLELRVPQDRAGRFSTELFERYQRSERALVAALAEMYVQGVSTRKVKAITEELCGHSFSASSIIEETLSFYRLPRQHHKHLKSTNMLERLNEEIKRRTHVVRIFPNGESCLRLVRALAVETHENWLPGLIF